MEFYRRTMRLPTERFGPETQLCPGRANRSGQSAAWWTPMRAVTSTSVTGYPSSRTCSGEAESSKSRPLWLWRVSPSAWQSRLGPEASCLAGARSRRICSCRNNGRKLHIHMHDLGDQKERSSAEWGRDGRGRPDRAGRDAGPGRPLPRRFARPKSRSPSDALAPCPAGAGPPTPAAPQRRRAAAERPVSPKATCPILPALYARRVGGERPLFVRFLPFRDQRQHFLSVAFRFNLGKDVQQGLVRADHECGPLDAPHFLSVHVLFLQNAKLIAHFLVYISKECVRQAVFGAELGLVPGCIAGDAKHNRAGRLELFEGIAEAAGLNGAARSIRSGVKEEYDRLAGVSGQAGGPVLVGLQGKVGDFPVKFHGGNSSYAK